MAYTTNPHLPAVRMEAIRLIKEGGWSTRKAARHLGFSHCTVRLWLERMPVIGPHRSFVIPTRSSRPRHHPRELSREVIARILALRVHDA